MILREDRAPFYRIISLQGPKRFREREQKLQFSPNLGEGAKTRPEGVKQGQKKRGRATKK